MKKFGLKLMTVAVAIATFTFAGCQEKDLYEPPVDNQENVKPVDEYFDFTTRADISVNIDYGYPGYKALFSIYTENPLNEDYTLKEGVEAAFKAFTREDNTFVGKVTLPTAAKKVYLYSSSVGLPTCVELDVTGAGIAYSNVEAMTRADELNPEKPCVNIGHYKQTINSSNKLYALYTDFDSKTLQPENKNVSALYSKVGNKENISSTTTSSTIGKLMDRVERALRKGNTSNKKKDNSQYIRDASITNISVKKYAEDGTTEIKEAHIELVALSSNPGSWHNALGYYYYKTGTDLTASAVKALPKYMAFPKLMTGSPAPGYKVRLQFFGENYDQDGVDAFPSGYTIGWCMIANLGTNLSTVEKIHPAINTAFNNNKVVYSNYFNANQVREGFITLKDETSGKLILGIEDTAFQGANVGVSDKSYEDMLFYVDADPIEAITGTDIPIITPEEILDTETTTGILAFEDIWPTGGDYDMNDVVVEYKSVVTFNQDNEIKKIEDTFKPIHDGADYTNAFGYVINNELGEIDAETSNYTAREETNQFIFFPNAKQAQNQLFGLTRIFSKGNYPSKATYIRNWNPFIAVNYVQDAKNRIEVHLPKYPATSWANQTLQGSEDDAYYIDKDGKYPFAIDVPVTAFKVAVEQTNIGLAYPKFDNWVATNGDEDADWYEHPSLDNVQE